MSQRPTRRKPAAVATCAWVRLPGRLLFLRKPPLIKNNERNRDPQETSRQICRGANLRRYLEIWHQSDVVLLLPMVPKIESQEKKKHRGPVSGILELLRGSPRKLHPLQGLQGWLALPAIFGYNATTPDMLHRRKRRHGRS